MTSNTDDLYREESQKAEALMKEEAARQESAREEMRKAVEIHKEEMVEIAQREAIAREVWAKEDAAKAKMHQGAEIPQQGTVEAETLGQEEHAKEEARAETELESTVENSLFVSHVADHLTVEVLAAIPPAELKQGIVNTIEVFGEGHGLDYAMGSLRYHVQNLQEGGQNFREVVQEHGIMNSGETLDRLAREEVPSAKQVNENAILEEIHQADVRAEAQHRQMAAPAAEREGEPRAGMAVCQPEESRQQQSAPQQYPPDKQARNEVLNKPGDEADQRAEAERQHQEMAHLQEQQERLQAEMLQSLQQRNFEQQQIREMLHRQQQVFAEQQRRLQQEQQERAARQRDSR